MAVVARRYRVIAMQELIVELYGRDALAAAGGGAVLDIAGGKGDLSWLLRNAHGIDSVVVDPRSTDHTKLARTAQWVVDNPAQAAEQQEALLPLQLAPPFRPARHVRLFVDDQLVRALATGTEQVRRHELIAHASHSL